MNGDENDEETNVDMDLDMDLELELAATEHVVPRSLAQLLGAPADLESRTQARVTTTLLGRSRLGTGADLLTVGWQAMRLMFTDPETDEEVTQ